MYTYSHPISLRDSLAIYWLRRCAKYACRTNGRTDAGRDGSRFGLGRMAVAGLAVATAAIAIGFGLAPWWAVIIPAVLSAVAGALLVQDPPSYSAAEAN